MRTSVEPEGARAGDSGHDRFCRIESTTVQAPQPASLEWINASAPPAKGAIPVSISQTSSAMRAEISVPEGTAARVCLPPAHGLSATLAQAQKLTVNGAAVATVVDGRMLCGKSDLAAGHYTLERM